MRPHSTRLLLISLALATACADPLDGDAGVDPDAGIAHDGGTVPDTGADPDAGNMPDTGADPDAGNMPDTGTAPDTGTVPDGGVDDGGPRVVPVVVAYAATADAPLHAELFLTSTNLDREKVNPPLAGGTGVGGKGDPQIDGIGKFEWTLNGEGIVYSAQQDTYDYYEVYLAPLPGLVVTATSSRLSTPGDYEVNGFTLVPRTNLVLFDQSPFGVSGGRDFLVEATPGAVAVQISQGSASRELFSPTRAQFVYFDIIVSADDRDLWFADLTVAPFVTERINPGANIGYGLTASWAPDGNALFYTADENASRVFEMYRVSVANGVLGGREQMLAPIPADRDVDLVDYSPDGTRVVFRANLEIRTSQDLYTIEANATPPATPTRLTHDFVTPGSGVARVQWSPNSAMIMYAADHDVANVDEVYVVPADGSAPAVRVHSPLTGSERTFSEQWISDSMVLYASGPSGSFHLYATPIVAGVPGTPIDLGPARSSLLGNFGRSPTGRYIGLFDEANDLQVLDVFATPPTMHRIGPASGGCWAPDDRLAIIAALDDPSKQELYYIEDVMAPDPIKVSGPLVDDGVVTACAFPPL